MKLDDILKYQECEQKIVELDGKINASAAKKRVGEISGTIKAEQENLRSLNSRADAVSKDFESNKKKFESIEKEIGITTNNFDEAAFNALGEADAKKALERINELVSAADNLQRMISVNGKEADRVAHDFNVSKSKIAEARNAGGAAKEALSKLVAEVEPQKAEFEKQLAELEKSVDKALLNKYKHARADNIFPVFVPLLNNTCGGCRMELSAAFINKLKESGCHECESCRRWVYIKR